MKHFRKTIALFLVVVMLTITMGSTVLAGTENQGFSDQAETTVDSRFLDGIDTAGYDYVITSQEQADELRVSDDSKSILVACGSVYLSGITAGTITIRNTTKIQLSNVTAKALDISQGTAIRFTGVKADQLLIAGEKTEESSLQIDSETNISKLELNGGQAVTLEGSGTIGGVEVKEPVSSLAVYATCKVTNQSGKALELEKPDGSSENLPSGAASSLKLETYTVTFVADGSEVAVRQTVPGTPVDVTGITPEKEGYIFTTWYQDAACTEAYSQFDCVNGPLTLYAGFTDAAEAVTVTFETFGGTPAAPLTFAKGETLLSKPVSSISTSKDGYTFGGWCRDETCTEPFAYTEPVQEDMTLYALFTSNEAVSQEKDGSCAELNDFDWQGEIPLITDTKMTEDEVLSAVSLEPGAGDLDPILSVKKTPNGFSIFGEYYEKDGKKGFEPGATFTVRLPEEINFADYSKDVRSVTVSVYKEKVEIVGFSEDIDYILWDQVISYTPAVEKENSEETAGQTEKETAELLQEEEKEILSRQEADEPFTTTEENEELPSEEKPEIETEADVPETETPAYEPGELLVKGTLNYEPGEIVAFYDGEIGRDEKSMDSYTEGSFDGYVLFAQVVDVQSEGNQTRIWFGYADPQDYLADFDVNTTDDVDLESQLSEEELQVVESKIVSQVEENEELKAQMLMAVMTSEETQKMINEKYGEGVYSLAGMNATLKPGKPSVKISASGSNVTATISISASAAIKNGSKTILTISPKLSFTQSLSVQTNVKGGKFWIDMSVTLRSTSKISLTVTASSGGSVKLFNDAKKTLSEIVKPEGLKDSNDYSQYDKNVSELMKTVGSIVNSSLVYNDIFNVVLLKLRFSFYGIITLGVDIDLVGQVGVLATFGVEIEVKSGERIGFEYKFLKFKGSSYTQKLESSVTSSVYLIGKVGARVGIRVTISITFCGFISTSIEGSVYAYAELSGFYYNTANLVSGASTELGALKFEVGIDVVVKLQLKVKLIFKTKKKSWTVYSGRWPLWSKSYSSGFSYMNQTTLADMWKVVSQNADKKDSFGFASIPMKNWDMAKGTCKESFVLATQKNAGISLQIQNLKVDGKAVSAKDPLAKLFYVGNGKNNTSLGFIYLDQGLAAKYNCKKAELDLVVTYTNNSKSAIVKKQVSRFHLSKKIYVATTNHTIKVVLRDWCADEWGLDPAGWDNALVYQNTFTSYLSTGQKTAEWKTVSLNLNQIIQKAKDAYPELAGMECKWINGGGSLQSGIGSVKDCSLDAQNGTLRYKVFADDQNYETTYYLYVHRFPGESSQVNYHISLNGKEADTTYKLWVTAADGTVKEFKKQRNGSYDLTINKRDFNGEQQAVMMSVNNEPDQKTSLSITGRESQKDVYLKLDLRQVQLVIQAGDGIRTFKAYRKSFFRNVLIRSEEIRSGTKVEIRTVLDPDYSDLEVVSTYDNFKYSVTGKNKITFTMPQRNITLVLRAYKRHKITFDYNLDDYGVYKTIYSTEKQDVTAPKDPSVPGYVFKGWYLTADGSGEPYEFDRKLKEDSTLYAQWEPLVSPEQILESITGVLSNHYTDSLEKYLPLENTPKKLQAEITGRLTEILEKENVYQLYGNRISFHVVLSDKVEETENQYIYTYWADILYKGLAGKEWEGTAKGSFVLGKMKPEVSVLPLAGNLKYQEKLALSPFTGGEVTYKENKVTGSFRWNEPELVPAGEDNGTAKYKATFIPDGDSAKLYTPVEFELPVKTQIGVRVSCKADSRDYEKGNVTTTGTYELTRAGDGMKLTDLELTDGIFKFEQETPGENLKVTFSGYKIRDDQNTDNLYVLLDTTAETTASIREPVPTDQILSQLIEIINGDYEDSIENYLPIEKMEEKVENSTVSVINEALGQNEFLKEYQNLISITAKIQDKGEPLADAYTYTLAIEAVVTTSTGNTYTETGTYQAVIRKLTPELGTKPETNILEYQKPLSDCVLKGGKVTWNGLEVTGEFSWKTPEVKPSGENNGTDNANYTVVFTPSEANIYLPVEFDLPVRTQIGVRVSCKADSRDYEKGNVTTTGTYELTRAGDDTKLENLELTDGIFKFEQETPGENLKVTFSGYKIREDQNADNLYVLLDTTAETTASIYWITPVIETVPTVAQEFEIGTRLKDIQNSPEKDPVLTDGKATYNQKEIPGTWQWQNPETILDQVGEIRYTMLFIPENTAGFKTIQAEVTVSTIKAVVTPPEIPEMVYNGQEQAPVIPETEFYKTVQNEKHLDAGEYNVTMELKNPALYRWPESEEKITILPYKIQKAKADITGTPDPEKLTLIYGQMLSDELTSETEPDRAKKKTLIAKDMISGIKVKVAEMETAGEWQWKLEESEKKQLTVTENAYKLQAVFQPADESVAKNVEPIEEIFTVKVKKAVPALTCKDFSGKLFNSIDNEGNVVRSYL